MWALFFMIRTSCGVESAHWPFWMGLMKRFLNSLIDPSRFSLMKFTMQWSGKDTKIRSFRYIHNPTKILVYIFFLLEDHIQAVSHSTRLFCRGVPVSTILLLVLIEFIALDTADASFFRMWPSSQITKSGPGANERERGKKKKRKSYTSTVFTTSQISLLRRHPFTENYYWQAHADGIMWERLIWQMPHKVSIHK